MPFVAAAALFVSVPAGAQPCYPPPSGLVSWWPANDSGDDIVGSNDASFVDGQSFAPGMVGQAFNFDGTNYAHVLNPVGLPVGGSPRTIETWIYARSYGSSIGPYEASIVQWGTALTTAHVFGLIFSLNCPGKLYFYGEGCPWCNPPIDLCSGNDVPLEAWTHVAVTYDGTTVTLYINGQFEGSAPRSLNTVVDVHGLTLGFRPLEAAHFNGLLDETRVYDRALSQAEIQGIFAACGAGVCVGGGGVQELLVTKAAGADITLSWGVSCSPADSDYEIYQGNLGNFGSYSPITCTTGGATTMTLTPQEGDYYYLVVPRGNVYEGSYGRATAGERIPAQAACLPQLILGCQ